MKQKVVAKTTLTPIPQQRRSISRLRVATFVKVGIASQPLHGIGVIAHIFCRYAIITDDPVVLQKIHHGRSISGADFDPVFQLVHFGLMESLSTFNMTSAIPSQKM